MPIFTHKYRWLTQIEGLYRNGVWGKIVELDESYKFVGSSGAQKALVGALELKMCKKIVVFHFDRFGTPKIGYGSGLVSRQGCVSQGGLQHCCT